MILTDEPSPWASLQQAQASYPTPPGSSGELQPSVPPAHASTGGHQVRPTGTPYPARLNSVGELVLDLGDDVHGKDACEIVVTVSTSFHPGSFPTPSDLILSSKEDIRFYVHTDRINRASPSALRWFLRFRASGTDGDIIPIPESGRILNIILHVVYKTSCAQSLPTCDELIEAIDKMPRYGLVPKDLIRPDTPVYTLLLTHVLIHPLTIYATAGHHDILELAQQASSHLLGFPLHDLDDGMAVRMGPVYLKRLFSLHMTRIEAVRELVIRPPGTHQAAGTCSYDDRQRVSRGWAVRSASLVWDAQIRADLSIQHLRSTYEPLAVGLDCAVCQEAVRKRIRELLVAWAAVKCTI